MQESTKLSFVLPLRNEEERAELTINSLLNQKVKCPIIIIDDCSTDNTYKIAARLHLRNPNIILLRLSEHRGAAYARNWGNLVARSEFIASCDSDEYYYNHSSILLEAIEEYPDVDVFYTSCDLYKEGRGISHYNSVDIETDTFFTRIDGLKKMPVSHPTACYRRDMALKHKYPEESLDTDCFEKFFMTFIKEGYKFKALKNRTMKIHRGTTKRNKRACEEIRRKHYAEFGIKYQIKENHATI